MEKIQIRSTGKELSAADVVRDDFSHHGQEQDLADMRRMGKEQQFRVSGEHAQYLSREELCADGIPT